MNINVQTEIYKPIYVANHPIHCHFSSVHMQKVQSPFYSPTNSGGYLNQRKQFRAETTKILSVLTKKRFTPVNREEDADELSSHNALSMNNQVIRITGLSRRIACPNWQNPPQHGICKCPRCDN